jgi:hypothetical protein
MVTRTHQRLAALAAVATAVPLTLGLVLFGDGPPTGPGRATRSYFVEHATTTRITALLWLVAAMAMVVFAVAVREAIWAIVVDRAWAAMLFVQGAVGFAAVSVVAAALLWAVADQAAAGALSADVAGTLWAVDRTLWRFATWGLTVPLIVVGLVLSRYSRLGQVVGAASIVLAVGLLLPATWGVALYGFAAWLVLAGLTFARPRLRRRQEVAATELVD